MPIFAGCLEALRDVGKPTIARLNGIVAGRGNELNLACDPALAAADVPNRQGGPPVGSARARLAPPSPSLEPWEGMTAFVEKRPPGYRRVRELARDGGSSETLWGPPAEERAAVVGRRLAA